MRLFLTLSFTVYFHASKSSNHNFGNREVLIFIYIFSPYYSHSYTFLQGGNDLESV